MNILFVTNNINVPGNGICTSVNTTVQHLRDKGIDARFLSGISKDPKVPQPDFPLNRLHFPIFQPIIDANGLQVCSREAERRGSSRKIQASETSSQQELDPLTTDKGDKDSCVFRLGCGGSAEFDYRGVLDTGFDFVRVPHVSEICLLESIEELLQQFPVGVIQAGYALGREIVAEDMQGRYVQARSSMQSGS